MTIGVSGVQSYLSMRSALEAEATSRLTTIGALHSDRADLAEAEASARDAAFEATRWLMLLTDVDLNVVGFNAAFPRLVNENASDFEIEGEITLDHLRGMKASRPPSSRSRTTWGRSRRRRASSRTA